MKQGNWKQTRKRIGSLLLALCMVLTTLPTAAFAAEAEYPYIDENGAPQTVSIDSANVIDGSWANDGSSGMTRLSTGWYIVTETVTLQGLIIDGDVKLILSDGAALTSSGYVQLSKDNSLTIYGQSGGTGSLTVSSSYTAIGYDYGSGSLSIYGGAVSAQSSNSTGIVAGQGLIIQNATVTASGSSAIAAGDVTISGGSVTAHSTRNETYWYGISANGTLSISGGTVKVTGGEYGLRSAAGNIVINGGSVDVVTTSAPPKNSGGTPVYKSTLLLPEAGPGASVSGTVSTASYYSFNGVKTDGEGKAYLWLPEGKTEVDLTAGSQTYAGTFTVNTDGSTLWPLATRTVTFDPKGGAMTDPTTAQTGETLKLAALPADPTLAGYTFDGWYSAYYGGEKITTDTVFYLDATVYARWKTEGGDGATSDTRNVDISKLTVNHTETGVWSYSASDKTLTVPAADGSLTLSGTNNDLQVKVTGAGVTLVLSNAAISASVPPAVSFADSATAENTLTLAPGTENTLDGGLNSGRDLTLSGTGKLTVTDTRDWQAAITVYSASLVIDGPEVAATGGFFGLSMGLYSISTGVLDVRSGSLTLDRIGDHYSQTLNSEYRTSLTVNVASGASLTVLNGDTESNTTLNNNGGTVYIDGNVAGTANNDDSAGGTFTVTGAVAHSSGTIIKPELPQVAIDLSDLEESGTEYYELVPGSAIPDDYDGSLDGYIVIKIKKPARFTLSGTAPSGYVLRDTHVTSEYILNGISIDGLTYSAFAVTVTGTNTVDSFGIPVAGGTAGACVYSGDGTLRIQNSDGKNPHGAFPADEGGRAVIDGCHVEISGFAMAGDGIRVRSGSLKADGSISVLRMEGGRADVWYLEDRKTGVDYTAGELALFGRLDEAYSDTPDISVAFDSKGGSSMPSLYLYGISSYTMEQPESPVKTGAAFDRWCSDEALTQPVAFPLAVTGNAAYYAKWRTPAITITRQPQDITVVHGETGELSVETEGGSPSYQWYSTNQYNSNYGGTELAGATSRVYTVPATLDLDNYYYYCKITAGQDVIHSDMATVKVKLPQTAPAAPTLESKTATSVTLVDMGSLYEYRCGAGGWQKSNAFSGLTPDTEYTFYLRLAETEDEAPSPAGPELTVSTAQAALEGDVIITGLLRYGETLQADTSLLTLGGDGVPSGILRYQWKRSGSDAVIGTASSYTPVQADIGQTLSLTVTAEGCPGASTDTRGPVQKGIQTPPPAPTGSCTGNGLNFTYTVNPVDGVKYGVEYAGGAFTWKESNVFTGLALGETVKFYLRYLETDIYQESGNSQALSVTFVKLNNPQAPPLNYTVSGESDDRTITITPVAGAEYKFGDDSWGGTSSKGGYTSASGAVTIRIRYAETGTHNASPEASVQVSPGKGPQAAPSAFILGHAYDPEENEFTVTIPTLPDAEYSFDGASYGDRNIITAAPGSTVTGYLRYKETDALNASSATTSTLTLPTPATGITVTGTDGANSITANGGTLQMQAQILPPGALQQVTWSVTGVGASINASGLLTAGGNGTVTVTATAKDGYGAYGSMQVTISGQSSGQGGTGNGGGGGGTAPSAVPDASVVSGSTATTTVMSTVGSDGKAAAAVTQSQISDALTKAQEAAKKSGETPKIEIQIAGVSGASAVAATIPNASVQSMASGGVGSLTIASGLAAITFDGEALKTIAGASAGDVTVSASQADPAALSAAARALVGDRPVYEFSVTSGGKAISQFGGSVTVSVPYRLGAGEDPNAVIVSYINASGNLETIMNGRYDAATGMVVFTTDHFSKYAIGYNEISFDDVKNTAWYADAVSYLAAREITGGTTAATFSPNATLTRGQFITMLLRAYEIAPEGTGGPVSENGSTETTEAAEKNFADAGDTYYTGYLAAAKRLAITKGVGDNKFAPKKAITRQEMFTLLYNALSVLGQLPESNTGKTLADFTDGGSVASYAQEPMNYLVKAEIVSGSGGRLDPAATTTRAQMAQVLYNLLSK